MKIDKCAAGAGGSVNPSQEVCKSKSGCLAFVHIEKAAGTTLIHILRRNYFLRYCDVRPLSAGSAGMFGANDMKIYLRLHPFVRCIAGHSIVPYGSLVECYPGLRFITVMREPVSRYVSQFHYLTRERAHKFSFREFLDDDHYANFQTRKIAESGNVDEARKLLSETFFLVGIVEQFDEFLLMLKKMLSDTSFDPVYRQRNSARDKEYSMDILDRYHDEIVERNHSDLTLYEYVKQEVLPSNKIWYGDTLESDIAELRRLRMKSGVMRIRSGVDYGLRKVYIEPITGVLRRISGLPAEGSY